MVTIDPGRNDFTQQGPRPPFVAAG